MKKNNVLLSFIILLVGATLAFGSITSKVSADATPTITVEATKVVCDTDAAMPHLANGANITATTATDYVAASNGHCQLMPGWDFQWSDQSTQSEDSNGNTIVPGDTVGPAAGFTTFGSTDANGSVTAILPFPASTTEFHLREILQSGYIPFTFETNKNNSNPDSAEFYCETDGQNYDNFEVIRNPIAGDTYHCVAFNVPSTPVVTPPGGGTQSPATPPIVIPPATTQTPSSGGSGGIIYSGGTSGGVSGGGGFPIVTSPSGQVLGASTGPVGQVLGASIDCGEIIHSYVKLGQKNDVQTVTNLQAFLNSYLQSGLTIDGIYGSKTFAAVELFQAKQSADVLLPWHNIGYNPNTVPTGYVYKTTKREINNIACPALDLPAPLIP